MRRMTIDTRLTFDDGRGLNLNYPWGMLQSYHYEGQRLEIEKGRLPIFLTFNHPHKGWTYLTDASGQPLYKFVTPEEVSMEYHKYEFWASGKVYIFEFRIMSFDGNVR